MRGRFTRPCISTFVATSISRCSHMPMPSKAKRICLPTRKWVYSCASVPTTRTTTMNMKYLWTRLQRDTMILTVLPVVRLSGLPAICWISTWVSLRISSTRETAPEFRAGLVIRNCSSSMTETVLTTASASWVIRRLARWRPWWLVSGTTVEARRTWRCGSTNYVCRTTPTKAVGLRREIWMCR